MLSLEQITDRFSNHVIHELGVAFAAMDVDAWHAMGFGPLESACGIEVFDSADGIVVGFCPPLVFDMLGSGTLHDVDHLLMLLELVIDLHLVYWDEADDRRERQELVDEQLHEVSNSLARYSALQLGALDRASRR